MIIDFSKYIKETIDNKGSFVVNEIYSKNNEDPELTAIDIENLLKDKLFRVENENGVPIYGPKYSLFSSTNHIITRTSHLFFQFKCKNNDTDKFVYLSDTILWKEHIFNEDDPYGEEDWEMNESNNNKFYLISDIIEKHDNIKDFIQEMENIFLGKIVSIKINNDRWEDVGWGPIMVEKIEWFDMGISYLEVKWEMKYIFLNLNDTKLISIKDRIKIVEPIISEDDPYGEEDWEINEQIFEPKETMTINTLEMRKELGETQFPDENTDYDNFSFNNRISERFLEEIKYYLVGNRVSFSGYCYHSDEKYYTCMNLIVKKVTLNLANVLCINSEKWPFGGSEVSGGAVDERHPIFVKIRERKPNELDPYNEEDWDD